MKPAPEQFFLKIIMALLVRKFKQEIIYLPNMWSYVEVEA